jgi:nicotinamidase/pyrazinamidase
MAKRDFQLLIIDPQNDFCDLPADYCPQIAGRGFVPALPVAGAHADMQRVATLIREGGAGLSAITLTQDAHHHLDIAHPSFWLQGDGSPVTPFTQISAHDVLTGRYRPRQAEALPRVLTYLDALEALGRYTHMVWPQHCEIGSWGQSVHPDVFAACQAWEATQLSIVNTVCKGSNPWTEHFSAIKAEVPDPSDDETQLNAGLLAQLREADRVFIVGEAGSHCVKATTEHIVEHFAPADPAKLVLVSDCMSPVAGFAAQYQDFVAAMRKRGVQIAQSADVLAMLQANA